MAYGKRIEKEKAGKEMIMLCTLEVLLLITIVVGYRSLFISVMIDKIKFEEAIWVATHKDLIFAKAKENKEYKISTMTEKAISLYWKMMFEIWIPLNRFKESLGRVQDYYLK